jgi:hypothetical protein
MSSSPALPSELLNVIGAFASIEVRGDITATGNITLLAEAGNFVAFTPGSVGALLLFRITDARVLVEDVSLAAGGLVSIQAINKGDRGTIDNAEHIVINVTLDWATATLQNAIVECRRPEARGAELGDLRVQRWQGHQRQRRRHDCIRQRLD